MTKRIWDKGGALDDAVLAFTVGDDPETDRRLVIWDCLGSAAHARMLSKVGLLAADDARRLVRALAAISERAEGGRFEIPANLEDVHSAIEATLVAELGELGERIHAGRSRNDQIILTMRLYLRHMVLVSLGQLREFAVSVCTRFDEIGDTRMPGHTHLQPAMPSSVGMWLHAFLEWTLELTRDGVYLLDALDRNPLGAAAGFGTTLPLDRRMTARLLGFSHIQRSPIDVQNSRGRFDLKVLRWASDIGSMCEKLACDLMLYTMEELRYFSIPRAFTTGSSIMPQKHNPDVIELSRARAARIRGAETELALVIAKLPSSYHRDLQYTKAPLMRGIDDALEVVTMMRLVIDALTVNETELEAAMRSELYATYEAFRRVQAGQSFRQAYRETAELVQSGGIDRAELEKDFGVLEARTRESVTEARAELSELEGVVATWSERLTRVATEIYAT